MMTLIFVVIITTTCPCFLFQSHGLEFVKHFRAHLHGVRDLRASVDGQLCCTVSDDRSVKVFDVNSFDMMVMIRLPFEVQAAEWCFR